VSQAIFVLFKYHKHCSRKKSFFFRMAEATGGEKSSAVRSAERAFAGATLYMPSEHRTCFAEPARNDYAQNGQSALDALTPGVALPVDPADRVPVCSFCGLVIVGTPFNVRTAICMIPVPGFESIESTRLRAMRMTAAPAATADDDDDDQDEDIRLGSGTGRGRIELFHDGFCWMLCTIVRRGEESSFVKTLRANLPHWAPEKAPDHLQKLYARLMEARQSECQPLPSGEAPAIPRPPPELQHSEHDVARVAEAMRAVFAVAPDDDAPLDCRAPPVVWDTVDVPPPAPEECAALDCPDMEM
jgi:hypothetical protein